MDNRQILRIAIRNPILQNGYIGTIPENMLPKLSLADIKRRKKPCFIIVNTQSDPNLFGHWILFVIKSNRKLIFFDSLGNHPFKYGTNIAEFCCRFKNIVLCTRKQLQSSKSITCGAFCIYVAMKICENRSVESIMKTFDLKRLENNDLMVEKFTVKLMNGELRCSDELCGAKTFETLCEAVCTCRH